MNDVLRVPQLLTIRVFPDVILRRTAHPVVDVGLHQGLIDDMIHTMYANQGAGLAAIQVGELLQIFVLDGKAFPSLEDDPLVFVNPVVKVIGTQQERRSEGCLSFPNKFVHVRRPARVEVSFLDRKGVPQTLDTVDDPFLAQAIQHETDHLKGALMADYLDQRVRKRLYREMETGQ